MSIIIKRAHFMGGEFIPIDELESPIGLRVEGGGYIFYDDMVAFSNNKLTLKIHWLAKRWGVEASYGTYYYDMLRGCVVREGERTCNRFMVVDETDMISQTKTTSAGDPSSSFPLWDTSANASTSRATYTSFGQGSANTTLLCNAITDTTTIWPTVKFFRYRNPQGSAGDSDSATDTRWFVPSMEELEVLNYMAFYDDSYRPSESIYSHRLQIPFWTYYWSSSQLSGSEDYAWCGVFSDGDMCGVGKDGDLARRVRLCRTF